MSLHYINTQLASIVSGSWSTTTCGWLTNMFTNVFISLYIKKFLSLLILYYKYKKGFWITKINLE